MKDSNLWMSEIMAIHFEGWSLAKQGLAHCPKGFKAVVERIDTMYRFN